MSDGRWSWSLGLTLGVGGCWLVGVLVLTGYRWWMGLAGLRVEGALAVGVGAVGLHALVLLMMERVSAGRDLVAVSFVGIFGAGVAWLVVEGMAQDRPCAPGWGARLGWAVAAVSAARLWMTATTRRRRGMAGGVAALALAFYAITVFPVWPWAFGGGAARVEAISFVGEEALPLAAVRWRDGLWLYDEGCRLFEYDQGPPVQLERVEPTPSKHSARSTRTVPTTCSQSPSHQLIVPTAGVGGDHPPRS